jgi:FkbM family methyltransferase
MGILNYHNDRDSGERRFLRDFLANRKAPVVLDVGANVGDYAAKVMTLVPAALLFAFEPHPKTFQKLKLASERYGFKAFNVGCGDENAKLNLYDYANGDGSVHASIYRDVIETVHCGKSVAHLVDVVRLDEFVERLNLKEIDLLKIDTEGNEMAVLKGFKRFIDMRKIRAIHFEFNEMNVVSRVFFKDFYDFLPGYEFYRALQDGLVPLKTYYPLTCEIFAFQNIVAVLRTYNDTVVSKQRMS